MDSARGALLPIATGLRLRPRKPGAVQRHVVAWLVKVPAEEVGWDLTSG